MPEPKSQSPCSGCRHSRSCGDNIHCPAFRVYQSTGRRITPPHIPPVGRRKAAQINEFERLAKLAAETNNNVLAWRVVQQCECPGELPEWSWRYLQECARSILNIEPTEGRLAHDVLDALGLAQPGGGPSVLSRAESASNRNKALAQMARRAPVIGVTAASEEAAGLSDYKASTLRQYHYRRVNKHAEFNLQSDVNLATG